MHETVVAVLRGGPSDEHEVSLKSGHSVLKSLPPEHYRVRDIYIDRQGVWHERGLQTDPGRVLPHVDVAFIAIHGAYGQDGEVQKILEQFSIPYTGADPYHAFHASHKVLAKEKAKEAGILTARYRFTESVDGAEALARDVARSFMQPVVVKPVDSGSSVGVSLAGGYQQIRDAVIDLFEKGARGVLVEERLRGTEATVGIIQGMRGEELYALPPVEIVPASEHEFFSYDAKYSGTSREIAPGRFSRKIAGELMDAARTMHAALNQRHYSRSDFMVTPKGIYFLELNTAAAVGMTEESLMPKALASVGIALPEFTSHVLGLARSV